MWLPVVVCPHRLSVSQPLRMAWGRVFWGKLPLTEVVLGSGHVLRDLVEDNDQIEQVLRSRWKQHLSSSRKRVEERALPPRPVLWAF